MGERQTACSDRAHPQPTCATAHVGNVRTTDSSHPSKTAYVQCPSAYAPTKFRCWFCSVMQRLMSFFHSSVSHAVLTGQPCCGTPILSSYATWHNLGGCFSKQSKPTLEYRRSTPDRHVKPNNTQHFGAHFRSLVVCVASAVDRELCLQAAFDSEVLASSVQKHEPQPRCCTGTHIPLCRLCLWPGHLSDHPACLHHEMTKRMAHRLLNLDSLRARYPCAFLSAITMYVLPMHSCS